MGVIALNLKESSCQGSWYYSYRNSLIPNDRVNLARYISFWSNFFLHKNEWPMNDEAYKYWSRHLHSLENSFIGTMSIRSLQTNKKNSLINWSKLFKTVSWKLVLENSGNNLKQSIWKIIAINLLSIKIGSFNAGHDGVVFKPSVKKEFLKCYVRRLTNLISSTKSKINQIIAKKDNFDFSFREKSREYIKSLKGWKLISDAIRELSWYTENISKLIKILIQNIKSYNNILKLKLFKFLSNSNILHYKAEPVLQTYTPKKNKIQLLNIPTLKDRTLQMLLKLNMESYMALFDDNYSFCFRLDIKAHLSAWLLVHKLKYYNNADSVKRHFVNFQDLMTKKEQKHFYTTKCILTSYIKNYFDNISHLWLIKKVPMPTGFEFLLKSILQVQIVEDITKQKFLNISNKNYWSKKKFKIIKKKDENISGVPQGGILSPIFSDWLLGDVEDIVNQNLIGPSKQNKKGFLKKFIFKNKLNSILKNNLKKYYKSTIKFDASFKVAFRIAIIRNIDGFILISNNKNLLLTKKQMERFLNSRGLCFISEKRVPVLWSLGNAVTFLSWRFYLLKLNKEKSKLTSLTSQRKRKFSGSIWLYVFPAADAMSRFCKYIKLTTSKKNAFLTFNVINKKLKALTYSWSIYYKAAPCLLKLFRKLDLYIFSRYKTFLIKKFGLQNVKLNIDKHMQKYQEKSNKTFISFSKKIVGF